MEKEKSEETEDFKFFVKYWLRESKVCRCCATIMDFTSGGQKPTEKDVYPKETEDYETYSEYVCSKCKTKLREETIHEWSQKA